VTTIETFVLVFLSVAMLKVIAFAFRNLASYVKRRPPARIDDPLGQARDGLEAAADTTPTVTALATIVASSHPLLKVAVAVQNYLLSGNGARVMFNTLEGEIRDQQEVTDAHQDTLDRLESPAFVRAVAIAVESTRR